MNLLLVASAALYALAGLALTFAPSELLGWLAVPPTGAAVVLAQTLGAAFLALAWLNWLHRLTRTRGILGRPVLLPNLAFTTMAALDALGAFRRSPSSLPLLAIAIGFGILAVAFGSRLYAPTVPGGRAGSS